MLILETDWRRAITTHQKPIRPPSDCFDELLFLPAFTTPFLRVDRKRACDVE